MSSNLRRPPVVRGALVRILTPYTSSAMTEDVQAAVGQVGAVLSEPDFEGDILVAVPGVDEESTVTYYVREWEPVEYAVEALQARVEALEAAVQAHAEWKRTFVQAAHAEAEERGWCSDFDDFMERHGLPRRHRDFEVLLEVTVKVTVPVSDAQSEEAAFAQARSALRTTPNLIGDGEVLSVESVAAHEV